MAATSWKCSQQICSNHVMPSCQHGPNSVRNVSSNLLHQFRIKAILEAKTAPTQCYKDAADRVSSECPCAITFLVGCLLHKLLWAQYCGKSLISLHVTLYCDSVFSCVHLLLFSILNCPNWGSRRTKLHSTCSSFPEVHAIPCSSFLCSLPLFPSLQLFLPGPVWKMQHHWNHHRCSPSLLKKKKKVTLPFSFILFLPCTALPFFLLSLFLSLPNCSTQLAEVEIQSQTFFVNLASSWFNFSSDTFACVCHLPVCLSLYVTDQTISGRRWLVKLPRDATEDSFHFRGSPLLPPQVGHKNHQRHTF